MSFKIQRPKYLFGRMALFTFFLAAVPSTSQATPTMTGTTPNLGWVFLAKQPPMWSKLQGTFIAEQPHTRQPKHFHFTHLDSETSKPERFRSRIAALPSRTHSYKGLNLQPSHLPEKTDSSKIYLAKEKKSNDDERELRAARYGLWHQITGISSLVLLAATVVIGQINAVDFFQNRLTGLPMIWTHRVLTMGTSVAYLGARILAWLLPSLATADESGGKYEGFDSAKSHRILAWVHGFGMVGLIATGIINAHLVPSFTLAKTILTASHLVLGYVTLAALTAAAIIISFF